jgi:hypothetical protein
MLILHLKVVHSSQVKDVLQQHLIVLCGVFSVAPGKYREISLKNSNQKSAAAAACLQFQREFLRGLKRDSVVGADGDGREGNVLDRINCVVESRDQGIGRKRVPYHRGEENQGAGIEDVNAKPHKSANEKERHSHLEKERDKILTFQRCSCRPAPNGDSSGKWCC